MDSRSVLALVSILLVAQSAHGQSARRRPLSEASSAAPSSGAPSAGGAGRLPDRASTTPRTLSGPEHDALLPADVIRRTIRRYSSALRGCYDRFGDRSGPPPHVEFHYTIGSDGRFTVTPTPGAPPANRPLQRCLDHVIEQMRIPADPHRAPIQIHYAFPDPPET